MKDQPNVESQMLFGISIVCVEVELEVGGELWIWLEEKKCLF